MGGAAAKERDREMAVSRGQDDGLDLAVARSLQEQYNKESAHHLQSFPALQTKPRADKASHSGLSIVDKQLELVDPNPNIHQLFVEFDNTFFWGTLAASGVAVDWSVRMTL